MGIDVRDGLHIPDAELSMRFTPSGGPGGQHANKANTRVELTWEVAESTAVSGSVRRRLVDELGPTIRVVVDDERSQSRNRDIAHDRLRARILGALHQAAPRRKTKPSRSSQRKRINKKKQRGQLKAQRRRPSMGD